RGPPVSSSGVHDVPNGGGKSPTSSAVPSQSSSNVLQVSASPVGRTVSQTSPRPPACRSRHSNMPSRQTPSSVVSTHASPTRGAPLGGMGTDPGGGSAASSSTSPSQSSSRPSHGSLALGSKSGMQVSAPPGR